MDDVGLTPGEPDTPAEPVEAVELVDTGEAAVVAVDRRLSRRQQSTLLGGMPSTRRAAGGLIVAVGASTVFIAVYWVPGHTAQYAVPGRPALLTVLLSFAVSVANFFV